MAVKSEDVARRRLAQSEAEFKRGLNMSPRDDYFYQGLAQLYFGWAKRSTSDEETAVYLAKAENMITEGLKMSRVRDSLWIVSSEINNWLGDSPTHIRALENAVRESPGSIVARYLLGRAYRNLGQPEQALEVLRPTISAHFEEFRSFVEYALAQEKIGKPYDEAIATLRQSTLYGLGDPRFIATLGGMLFLKGEFTEAQKIFDESSKRNFTVQELNTVQYRPCDSADPKKNLRVSGKVVRVRAGYSLIEVADYPTVLCPGSKYNGIVMEVGLRISFELVFAAKGSVAENPQVTSTVL